MEQVHGFFVDDLETCFHGSAGVRLSHPNFESQVASGGDAAGTNVNVVGVFDWVGNVGYQGPA